MSEKEYRSNSDRERDQRLAQQQAQREERRAKEQAQREERKAKDDAARGTRSSGPTKRQEAKQAAKEYGIDTKGMSTREIKAAVSEAETAQKQLEDDMSKFIEKTLNNFTAKKGGDVAPMDNPASVTNRLTETQPLPFSSSVGPASRRPSSSIRFYCYYDGQAGYLNLFGDPAFNTDL